MTHLIKACIVCFWYASKMLNAGTLVFYGVITYYDKFGGIKQHKFIIIQVCSSEVWLESPYIKIKGVAGLPYLLEALGEMFPCS